MEQTRATRELRGQSRVLVLGSGHCDAGERPCVPTLGAGEPSEQHVLMIAYDRPPETVVDDWQATHGTLPASMAIIAPTAEDTVAGEHLPPDVHVTQVRPDDLTGVGIAVGRYLDRWHGPAVVCLDSLTTLLGHAEEDRVFRFLHTLTGRFVAADAAGHVHLDPATQDERTVATLATLFDTVVRRTDAGWQVEG